MTTIAVKFAASTLVLGLALAGTRSDTATFDQVSASAPAPEQAHAAYVEARAALQRGELARATELIETAVSLSPRDAGYRLLLADAYLKAGRFESARATYADVIDLDDQNSRARLSYALSQIALGRPEGALAHLDAIAGRASPADVGLAFALAGQPERGIELLEPAARSLTASPRLRQNLALAYAVAGKWEKARAIAAQDLPADEVGPRLRQWAGLTRPDAAGGQVASLLGIRPVSDPGQPVHLALHAPALVAPIAPVEAFAAVEAPEPAAFEPVEYAGAPVAPPHVAFAPAPVAPAPFAPAPMVEAPASFAEAPAPAEAVPRNPVQRRYVSAAKSLLVADPSLIRAAAPEAAPPPPVFAPTRAAPAERRIVSAAPGRFVVQIGAFSTPENAERAWVQAEQRFGLRTEQPLTTTIDLDGRVLHRVSVAGFGQRGEATRLCGSIRSKGGQCFVREIAGDAPVRWAARYAKNA